MGQSLLFKCCFFVLLLLLIVLTQWHIPWLVLWAWRKKHSVWFPLSSSHMQQQCSISRSLGGDVSRRLVGEPLLSGARAAQSHKQRSSGHVWKSLPCCVIKYSCSPANLPPHSVAALLSSLVAGGLRFRSSRAVDTDRLAVLGQSAGLLRWSSFGVASTLLWKRF